MTPKDFSCNLTLNLLRSKLEGGDPSFNVEVFHAGTQKELGKIITASGRVLGVTARDKDIPEAISRAYGAVNRISWEGERHRTDIGQKALKHGVQTSMGV